MNSPGHIAPPLSIKVDSLSMQYGTKRVLNGISLEVPAGQRIAVLGPNGAGKSTMIEVFEGFRRPSAGRLSVLGENPASASSEWKSQLGIVLQAWRDHGSWRVRDFLQYMATAHNSAGRTARDVDEMLDLVDLKTSAKQQLRSLSGGQRRRVDVAAALIGHPDLLFLDEPTTGFDPEIRRSFHRLISALAGGTTIVWATHDLHEAEAMCDRIVILVGGKIVADGSPAHLRQVMADNSRVSWRTSVGSFHRNLPDPMPLLASLVNGEQEIYDLEVKQGSLEDAYLAIVRDNESSLTPVATLVEVGSPS